jgi:asparagine synthase (glutamine-hydrolysing)
MCGIIGVASLSPIQNPEWLVIGRDLLRSRGPDQFGESWFKDGRIGLGHRRLSIQDTSELGRQPLSDREKNLHIVFNGEIYNFKEIRRELKKLGVNLSSNSDTEVLLLSYKQWGLNCFNRLTGSFAFAIYDEHKNKLILARDRAGEKPLFILREKSSVRFCSEIKGILADTSIKTQLNESGLRQYFQFGYTSGNKTILNGIERIEPGHFAIFDLSSGDYESHAYWEIPELEKNASSYKESDLISEMNELITRSVNSQLVSDVPLGILLSGGLDSSVITAIAAQSIRNVKTFHISFPGFGSHDESNYAKEIASFFSTEHIELNGNINLTEELPKILKSFDEPLADSSILPTYTVSKLAREHCTVVLGGDGGDELFGGYSHYRELAKYESFINGTPFFIRDKFDRAQRFVLPMGSRGRAFGARLAINYDGIDVRDAPFFHEEDINDLLRFTLNQSAISHIDTHPNSRFIKSDLVEKRMRCDFAQYLPDDILVKVDRCGMMNSLEIRAPFLDKDLIEFCFKKLATKHKVNKSDQKIIFKKMASQILPKNFQLNRKQGFSFPFEQKLKSGPYRKFATEILMDANTFFNKTYVNDLFRGLDHGRRNGSRIFMLMAFELWRTGNGF